MKTNQQESLITHCPQCQTYFKLFKEQLDAADGMVRCGTCAAIFNAKDSLVTMQPTPSHQSSQAHENSQSQTVSNPYTEHTEKLTASKITLEDIEKNLFADFQLVQSSDTATHIDSQKLSINAFLRSSETPPKPLQSPATPPKNSNDALPYTQKPLPLAEQKNLLIEPKPPLAEPKAPPAQLKTPSAELKTPFIGLKVPSTEPRLPATEQKVPPKEQKPPLPKQQAPLTEQKAPPKEQKTSSAEEEINFNLWNLDLNQAAEVKTPSKPEISVAAIITPPAEAQTVVTKSILQNESNHTSEPLPHTETPQSSGTEGSDPQKNTSTKNRKKPLSALKNLLAEPIDTQETKHHHGIFQIKWLLILILSLILLAAQHLYFNFSTLALEHNYRPWYEKACTLLGCQLPDQKDIRLMKAQKLIVRTHPEKAHYLMIDAIILNTAPYAQAFPNIQLSFSDIQSTQVISEIFPPEIWKNDALKKLDKMPSNTPIQISLEMKDPGAHVPNYQIHFLE